MTLCCGLCPSKGSDLHIRGIGHRHYDGQAIPRLMAPVTATRIITLSFLQIIWLSLGVIPAPVTTSEDGQGVSRSPTYSLRQRDGPGGNEDAARAPHISGFHRIELGERLVGPSVR